MTRYFKDFFYVPENPPETKEMRAARRFRYTTLGISAALILAGIGLSTADKITNNGYLPGVLALYGAAIRVGYLSDRAMYRYRALRGNLLSQGFTEKS